MQYSYFNSDELTLLTAVLDRVCADEHIVDESERASIGERIIFKAQSGEWRLQALANYAARGGQIPQLQARENKSGHYFPTCRFAKVDLSAHRRA